MRNLEIEGFGDRAIPTGTSKLFPTFSPTFLSILTCLLFCHGSKMALAVLRFSSSDNIQIKKNSISHSLISLFFKSKEIFLQSPPMNFHFYLIGQGCSKRNGIITLSLTRKHAFSPPLADGEEFGKRGHTIPERTWGFINKGTFELKKMTIL